MEMPQFCAFDADARLTTLVWDAVLVPLVTVAGLNAAGRNLGAGTDAILAVLGCACSGAAGTSRRTFFAIFSACSISSFRSTLTTSVGADVSGRSLGRKLFSGVVSRRTVRP